MTGVFIKIVSLSRSNAYRQYVSRAIRKPVVVFRSCENKSADHRTADQRLCFRRFIDSYVTISLLPESEATIHFYGCTARFELDLFGNPRSRDVAYKNMSKLSFDYHHIYTLSIVPIHEFLGGILSESNTRFKLFRFKINNVTLKIWSRCYKTCLCSA